MHLASMLQGGRLRVSRRSYAWCSVTVQPGFWGSPWIQSHEFVGRRKPWEPGARLYV